MEVYLTSPWIPSEWVRAHGLEPRGVWSAPGFCRKTPQLSAGCCAFAESVLGIAEPPPGIAGRIPPAIVFATSCDQLRRAFDIAGLGISPNVFLFNIPATQTSAAELIYRSELDRLGCFLCELGGSAPSNERLRTCMLESQGTRRRLLDAAIGSQPRAFAESIDRFHHDGSFCQPDVLQVQDRVPLALVGGPLLGAQFNIFDIVESAGGQVALNATETGERTLLISFQDSKDPLESLAAGYLENMMDVFQRPNARLYSWLQKNISERKICGILLWHFTGCDLWRAEMQTLREQCGVPVLLVEADETLGCSPREINRIEAFVETLR